MVTLFAILCSAAFSNDPALVFPSLKAETLQGKELRIPENFPAAPTWVVIGFTKDSQKSTERCSSKIEALFPGRGYSAAILQGAPFFIKGVIKRGIRSSVPENRHDRYLIFNDGKKELEKLTGVSASTEDDAFILGIQPRTETSAEVAFVSHGGCDDAHFSTLSKQITHLVKTPSKPGSTK